MRKSLLFVWRTIREQDKNIIPIGIVNFLFSAINTYIFNYVIRYLLQIVEYGNELQNFFVATIVSLLFLLSIEILCVILEKKFSTKLVNCRLGILPALIEKVLTMKYQNLENTEKLDEFYKALKQTGNPMVGIEAAIRNSFMLMSTVVGVILGEIIIWKLSGILAVTIIIFSLFRFYFVMSDNIKDKKLVWDNLPHLWRKQFYYKDIGRRVDTAKDIRLYNLGGWVHKKISDVNQQVLEKQKESIKIWNRNHVIRIIIDTILLALFYFILIYKSMKGEIDVADFIFYVGIMSNLEIELDGFFWKVSAINRNLIEIKDYINFIENGEDVTSVETNENPNDFDKFKVNEVKIRLEHVYFKYPGQTKYTLSDICFEIENNESVAFVGLNGSGKSTLIKLLCRLYTPTRGNIYLNNINIEKIPLNVYFKIIGPIFQDVEIYTYSVAENVSMHVKRETDYNRVEEALKKIKIWNMINSMKDGLNTELLFAVEDGINMSGGEKQKLSVARALYKDCPIMILDEPTASLDPKAETNLYNMIYELMDKKTIFFVSHRLVSTRFCDLILFFSDGKLCEKGSHSELMRKRGDYAFLYNLQSNHYGEN